MVMIPLAELTEVSNLHKGLQTPAGDDGEAFHSLPENIKSTVKELLTAIDRYHSDSITAEKLIVGLARQLDEGGLCKRDCISRKIKDLLNNAIEAGKVITNWIHKCLPVEYKRKYVGKVTSHLSWQQPQQKVAVMQGGKSVTVTEQKVGNGSGTSPPQSEQGITTGIDSNFDSDIAASKSVQRGNGISSVAQQPVCKHCQAKDVKIMELEEAVRTHTSIKSAEELMYGSNDGYQQFEFPVPFEALRRHMVYFNGINGPLPDSVWFNGKFDYRTGKVEGRIGRTTGTDTTDVSRMTP